MYFQIGVTMKIKIINFEKKKKEIDIPDDFDWIMVLVISGDEIVSVWKDDKRITDFFDSSNDRYINYFDETYCVAKEDIQKWSNRKDSHDGITYRSFPSVYFKNTL